jgi:GntR family transcriptional regulator, transcriptional repressor for pyruvate dehydrogenase complex
METTEIFGKIERPQRLPDNIANSIIGAIDSGKLKPGDRLPSENELSARFGVARTVVREAVSLLKYDGVINSRQGVGAFIANSNSRSAFRIGPACFEKRQQLVEILELRTSVQSEASAMAAARRSAEDLTLIQNHLQEMENSVLSDIADAEKRVDSELAFYRNITAASGNSQYVEFIGMIESRLMENLRSVVVKNAIAAEWGSDVLEEHRAVFIAVKDGLPDAARDATRFHFVQAAKRLADRADIKDI